MKLLTLFLVYFVVVGWWLAILSPNWFVYTTAIVMGLAMLFDSKSIKS